MKKRTVFWMGVAGVLFCSFSLADAAQTLTRMGASPFYKQPLASVADLNEMVNSSQESLAEGFKKAGYPELFNAFMTQFPTVEIHNVQVQQGEALQWMMYRRNGKGSVRVMKDLVWGGEEPFDAFEFFIESSGKRYRMIVPLICGNVALKDVADVPEVAETPPPEPVPPPEEIKSVEAATPEPEETVADMRRGRLLADVGAFRVFDPLNFYGARLGYEYRFTPNYSLVGMVGFFLAEDNDSYAGDDAFTADVLFNYRYDRMFAGVGLGAWISDYNDQVDAVFNVGVRLFGDPEAFNTSLFFEVRSDVEEFDDIVDKGRFGIGLRFQF